MKISNKERILRAFKAKGNRMTLGFILKHSWGYKFCARCSELRHEGYNIEFVKGDRPSKNIYILWNPNNKS